MFGSISFGQDNVKIEINEKEQINLTYSEPLNKIDSTLRIQTEMIPKYNLFLDIDKEGNSRVLLISIDNASTSDYLKGVVAVNQLMLELIFNDTEVYFDERLNLPFRSRFNIVLD